MGDTLALATRLRAMTDAALLDALHHRAFSANGIDDFFDLAEALLEHASVQEALSGLERRSLAALAAAGERDNATVSGVAADLGAGPDEVASRIRIATDLLLSHLDGETITVYSSVTHQLRAWPSFGLPSREELAAPDVVTPPSPITDDELRSIDRLAADHAFTATATMTTMLLELEREPARALAKGGMALPDKKRLADAIVTDLDTALHYLEVASLARLVARENGTWLTTEAGNAWLLDSTPRRWHTLAEGWLRSLPSGIRLVLDAFTHARWGSALSMRLTWQYPAGGEPMAENIAELSRSAELLGITANEEPSTIGSQLLRGNTEQVEETLTRLLPTEVEKVYLQHDLSVVAPGPLTPAVDARLRLIADAESRALAASYRVSTSSVNRALASGETAESLLAFLGSVSLTGIPQPLEYLITESAARYGLVRVGQLDVQGADPDHPEYPARSYLRSEHADLLGTITVDQSLAALGLKRTGTHRVASRFPFDAVFWALSDARYPVAAENADGEIVVLERRRVAGPPRAVGSDRLTDLVQRLRSTASEHGSDRAWLVKQLDSAVRNKTAVTVSVNMPDGGVTDMLLEPASVAGGRLRARDPNSDTERTLPLSSIAAVTRSPAG